MTIPNILTVFRIFLTPFFIFFLFNESDAYDDSDSLKRKNIKNGVKSILKTVSILGIVIKSQIYIQSLA